MHGQGTGRGAHPRGRAVRAWGRSPLDTGSVRADIVGMTLPPGFLDELRGRISLSQVVGRKVVWDGRKSNQGRGDFWAPCPFHQEKTASFHVDDRKGFYYCFGCHAKGDAISFVRESENVEFMEAVRILAGEAGLSVPDRDPRAAQKADRRDRLIEVMEQAQRFFRTALAGAAGARARTYLEGRGLDSAAQERWGIGMAPAGWRGLAEQLQSRGVDEALAIEAGLIRRSDRGRDPYDVFRNRIMFPIHDPRGRCIAFGGRALDPDEPAKYLNSPETPLFDKGRTLYNHGPAREAAGKGAPLIVAEGYMDVIALGEAGLSGAVAPLGTAVTEEQLALLWRIHPEPVVALDGDKAGLRAAERLMDLALPRIEAGQSLRFCLMPPGKDPDDVLKSDGPERMRALVDEARPMVDLLWERETQGRDWDSPERRATLDKTLRAAISAIKDPTIRRHYGDIIRDRRWQLFNPRRARGRGGAARHLGAAAVASTRASALVAGALDAEAMREAVILAILLRHPVLVARFEDEIEAAEFEVAIHGRIAELMLRHSDPSPDVLRRELDAALPGGTLEKVLSARHLSVVPALRTDDADLAAICLEEEIAGLAARQGARREIAEALQDIGELSDEALTWRLRQATEAMNRAEHRQAEDRVAFDEAPNGVRLDRSERSALDDLLSRIGFSDDTKEG